MTGNASVTEMMMVAVSLPAPLFAVTVYDVDELSTVGVPEMVLVDEEIEIQIGRAHV